LNQEKPLPLREGSAKMTRKLSFNCNRKRSNNAAFDEASRYKTASYNTGGVNVDHSGRINKSATKNTEKLPGLSIRVDIEV
jgi:hypothetical protein